MELLLGRPSQRRVGILWHQIDTYLERRSPESLEADKVWLRGIFKSNFSSTSVFGRCRDSTLMRVHTETPKKKTHTHHLTHITHRETIHTPHIKLTHTHF